MRMCLQPDRAQEAGSNGGALKQADSGPPTLAPSLLRALLWASCLTSPSFSFLTRKSNNKSGVGCGSEDHCGGA